MNLPENAAVLRIDRTGYLPSGRPIEFTRGLYRSDIAGMQTVLEGMGYDVGTADGLPGFRTRRAIGDWQQKNGRAATCFPDKSLVDAIR